MRRDRTQHFSDVERLAMVGYMNEMGEGHEYFLQTNQPGAIRCFDNAQDAKAGAWLEGVLTQLKIARRAGNVPNSMKILS
jgi:hypothetical protein